ncbi:hypothetical protein JVT61DRAFT_10452 [Boletus reticuloceps]|uniref:DUF1275 domain protein n=1 Tax=Boletus reticuloceps TaxID=495285 RepID=A0A8I2YXB8_9AGAM|nr:hypothetical protein JVT61DRAFT_10452 [Boletus reticuloceps]
MWTDSLVARFQHKRTSTFFAQGAPLIPRMGSRPISTMTLDPVPDLERNSDDQPQPCDSPVNRAEHVPAPPISQVTATTVDEKQTGEKPTPQVASKHDTSLAQVTPDIESIQRLGMRSIRSFFMEEIDTAQAAAPLTAYCFMTGFIDAVSFSAIFVWCAFQTGNSVQLALALARLFNGQHDTSFHIADQQALCSLLCFVSGAFIGRIGDKIGCKTRAWLTLGTLIQTLFTIGGAITIWQSGSGSVADNRGDPAWNNTLSFVTIGFISASMGLQGIMGKRLNTQFTTTVVLTTTWCELMTEPQLFNFRRLVVARDHKVMAILFLFIGGFISRAILDKIGSGGTLGVGAGIRLIIAFWWLLIPAKKAAQK